MFNFDILDDLNNDPVIENVKLDLDQIKLNVPSFTNEKLCDMIIADRYLGFRQKIAPICMEELAIRRAGGDNFKFEEYIEVEYKKLPKLDFTIPDIKTALSNAIGKKI